MKKKPRIDINKIQAHAERGFCYYDPEIILALVNIARQAANFTEVTYPDLNHIVEAVALAQSLETVRGLSDQHNLTPEEIESVSRAIRDNEDILAERNRLRLELEKTAELTKQTIYENSDLEEENERLRSNLEAAVEALEFIQKKDFTAECSGIARRALEQIRSNK